MTTRHQMRSVSGKGKTLSGLSCQCTDTTQYRNAVVGGVALPKGLGPPCQGWAVRPSRGNSTLLSVHYPLGAPYSGWDRRQLSAHGSDQPQIVSHDYDDVCTSYSRGLSKWWSAECSDVCRNPSAISEPGASLAVSCAGAGINPIMTAAIDRHMQTCKRCRLDL